MAAGDGKSFEDSPFKKLINETQQSSSLRQSLIGTMENQLGAKVVTFFTSFGNRRAQINDNDAEMLESLLLAEHDGKKVVLVINSPGGQALAAERIVNVCRAYSGNKFEVLVPHMAKSAATMICFGSAKIHMSMTSELGPVDPQVPYWEDGMDRDGEPKWISAEEFIRSYDKLMDRASNGKAKRIEPFLQQLSRYDDKYIEQLRSVQKLSSDISVRLLKSSMMKRMAEKSIRSKIDVFLTQARTSSHGRMINAGEAKKCGLRVQIIPSDSQLWQVAWELYVRSDWVVSTQVRKLIETSKSSLNAA